jgi:hypothetical protein
VDDVDQLLGRKRALGVWLSQRIGNPRSNIVFNHFGHKTIDGAPRASDDPQHIGTADFPFECAFDSFNLAANPSHAVQQLGLFPSRIQHAPLLSTPDFRAFCLLIGDTNKATTWPSLRRRKIAFRHIQSRLSEKELKET